MIEETLFEAEEKMERAVDFAKDEFAAIRTGRATPGMFSRIVIDYYGSPTPLPPAPTPASQAALTATIPSPEKLSRPNPGLGG